MLDMNAYRSNAGRCAALESILDSSVFKEAIEAINNTNKTTEAMTIAANMDGSEKLELRLMNQQVGREGLLRDLAVCAIPMEEPKQEQPATYGADDAVAALMAPDAPNDPWQLSP